MASSVWVDRQDSNDWIAPCIENHPVVDYNENVEKKPLPPRRRISSASEAGDPRELWDCMLELQQRYGCYRSARMEAAISGHDGADMMRKFSLPDSGQENTNITDHSIQSVSRPPERVYRRR